MIRFWSLFPAHRRVAQLEAELAEVREALNVRTDELLAAHEKFEDVLSQKALGRRIYSENPAPDIAQMSQEIPSRMTARQQQAAGRRTFAEKLANAGT